LPQSPPTDAFLLTDVIPNRAPSPVRNLLLPGRLSGCHIFIIDSLTHLS